MLSVNFTELNDSIKTFILSVAVGAEGVIDNLLNTVERHLKQLEVIDKDTLNAQLHFECSVQILTNAYTALSYINYHSADIFNEKKTFPLDSDLRSIEKRFTEVFANCKKLGFK